MTAKPDWSEGFVWQPEREGFDRYLEDTTVVDWQTPRVLERARLLGAAGDAEEGRVRAAYLFVRDQISQSLDVETDALPCTASQVLKEETGVSFAKSHLLAALLRARGTPAGFAYQRISDSATRSGQALHAFVVAWLSLREQWVALDPRGNCRALQSEFRVDPPPSLAHEPDPERGELVFPVIFARPLPRVVDLLDRVDSLSRARRHFPDNIVP